MPKEATVRARVVEDDEDDFRKRAAVSKKDKQERGLFKLPEGETTFRILKTPSDKERNSPKVWMEYYVHRNVGPKKVGPLRCGIDEDADTGTCWLCSMVEKLREAGKTVAAADMERKKTLAVQVAVFEKELGDYRGPLLWVTSSGKSAKSLSYKLISIFAAPENKRYVNHEDGFDFTLDRTGTGMTDTIYGAPVRAEDSTEVPEQIVKKLRPFADVITAYSKDAQKNAYYGTEGETEEAEVPKKRARFDEDEEDEAPVIKKKKSKPVVEDEDEEDSIDNDPEDDEEDETPVAKKKKSKPVVEDEDEDDDLEFGEDEKPKKKVKVEDDEDDDLESEDLETEDLDEDDEEPVAKKKPSKAKVDEEEVKPKAKKRR